MDSGVASSFLSSVFRRDERLRYLKRVRCMHIYVLKIAPRWMIDFLFSFFLLFNQTETYRWCRRLCPASISEGQVVLFERKLDGGNC